MTKFLVAMGLLAAMATGGVVSSLAAAQTPATLFEARVGDRIEVAGARIGCQVVRVKELGRRVVVECRRAGALKGTYATLLSAREAVLVEFESRSAARQVAVAVHNSRARRCR
jgi:hypothetical protein